jgi:hypothetical protein
MAQRPYYPPTSPSELHAFNSARREKPSKSCDLESLEEQRLATVMRQACHDQQLRRYHDRNIKETSFNVGDLVLRRIKKTDGMHKLSDPGKDPSSSPKLSTHPISRPMG